MLRPKDNFPSYSENFFFLQNNDPRTMAINANLQNGCRTKCHTLSYSLDFVSRHYENNILPKSVSETRTSVFLVSTRPMLVILQICPKITDRMYTVQAMRIATSTVSVISVSLHVSDIKPCGKFTNPHSVQGTP